MMELRILAQDHMFLQSYEAIQQLEENKNGHSTWNLYGMPGRVLIGSFRSCMRVDRVLMDMIAAYNDQPQQILTIPEDDEGILTSGQNCTVKFSMDKRDGG